VPYRPASDLLKVLEAFESQTDGLLVPSARNSGVNLVVFTRKQGAEADFEITEKEILS